MSESKSLTQVSASLTAPSWIQKGDDRGTTHLTKADLQMPRLALAQPLSPQVQETDSKWIEGLKPGDMFNSLTGQSFGRGPIYFTVVRADRPRGIEFYPLSDGGGIKDFNVPANDPRMSFGDRGEKPLATLFYDYVVLLIDPRTSEMEPIALSFKSSALKVARALNALMKLRQAPSFAGLYELTTAMEKNNKGTYAVYRVRNAPIGIDDSPIGWASERIYKYAEGLFDAIKDRVLVVDRESESPVEGEIVDSEVPF